jgi:hypothetical protein
LKVGIFSRAYCWVCSLGIINNVTTPTACNMGSELGPCPYSGSPLIANHTQIVNHSVLKKSQETFMVTGLMCRNGEVGKFVWAPAFSALKRALWVVQQNHVVQPRSNSETAYKTCTSMPITRAFDNGMTCLCCSSMKLWG